MSVTAFLLSCYVIALDMMGLSSRTATSQPRTKEASKP